MTPVDAARNLPAATADERLKLIGSLRATVEARARRIEELERSVRRR